MYNWVEILFLKINYVFTFKAFLSVSKESLWILENPKLHISMRVGTPAELSVKQSIWKNGTFERNIQINILFFILEYSSKYSCKRTLDSLKRSFFHTDFWLKFREFSIVKFLCVGVWELLLNFQSNSQYSKIIAISKVRLKEISS